MLNIRTNKKNSHLFYLYDIKYLHISISILIFYTLDSEIFRRIFQCVRVTAVNCTTPLDSIVNDIWQSHIPSALTLIFIVIIAWTNITIGCILLFSHTSISIYLWLMMWIMMPLYSFVRLNANSVHMNH